MRLRDEVTTGVDRSAEDPLPWNDNSTCGVSRIINGGHAKVDIEVLLYCGNAIRLMFWLGQQIFDPVN